MGFMPEWTWYNIAIVGVFVAGAFSPCLGMSEKQVVWSKFAIGKEHMCPVSARAAMLLKYIPSVVLIASKVAFLTGELGILEAMMLLHFGKRVLEVLFLHDFSGSPIEDSAHSSSIGFFYAFQAWLYCRDGAQAEGLLLYAGMVCFSMGLIGNWYHHLLLARLRKPDVQSTIDTPALTITKPDIEGTSVTPSKYKIPMGGLFGLVTCPHYFFEILGFWGAAIAAFSLVAMSVAFSTTALLTGHAVSTTRWYKEKFGSQWPEHRKHILPFIF